MIQGEAREISELDTRFEKLKMKDFKREAHLAGDLLAKGQLESLLITISDGILIVLDGFKRLRIAKKLKWTQLQCISIGSSEAEGVVELLRRANGNPMNLYDEACFVLELYKKHGKTHAQISDSLKRSKGWVSMRVQFFNGMNKEIQQKIQNGAFPLHAWMYSVRPFTRMNDVSSEKIDEFVKLMSRQKYTLREIDFLSKVWFEGKESMREEIRQGKTSLLLQSIEKNIVKGNLLSAREQDALKVLSLLENSIRRFSTFKFSFSKEESREYCSGAHLSCSTVLANLTSSQIKLEELHDRYGNA